MHPSLYARDLRFHVRLEIFGSRVESELFVPVAASTTEVQQSPHDGWMRWQTRVLIREHHGVNGDHTALASEHDSKTSLRWCG